MRKMKLARKAVKLFVVFLILAGVSGILKVNETLPDAAKDYSSFAVEREADSGNITVKIKDYRISLDNERFTGFVRGIAAIGNAVKNAVVK